MLLRRSLYCGVLGMRLRVRQLPERIEIYGVLHQIFPLHHQLLCVMCLACG